MEKLKGKKYQLAKIAMGMLLIKSLWFSASAVIPQLADAWTLNGSQRAWLTVSVQIGFVAGAIISSVFNLADRYKLTRLLAFSGLVAAASNAAIPMLSVDYQGAIALRFITGMGLAGVYPPGMKLVATWCKTDRGFGIGLLVAALTVGSSLPHLLNAVPQADGMPPWRTVLLISSMMAIAGAWIVGQWFESGPYLSGSARLDWRHATDGMAQRSLRLANFGYLGHMWELYAMWAWAPLLLISSYNQAGWSTYAARLAGFGTIAIGALGALMAGILADRLGRTFITSLSLAISGICCMLVGFFYTHPFLLTILCLIWGVAVVADSAQFSAAISELSHPDYVGTTLTVQTSLGFLLSAVTIWLIPYAFEYFGWRYAFWVLIPGPALGLISMIKLRTLPEAIKMASGNR